MDIHCEAYPIMNTHHWITDIHNWTSRAVEITRMYLSWIILWYYRHILAVLQGVFLNLTHCKCSWRRDLLHKADIFQNDNEKTSCHAAYIFWNIYIYIEYSNAVRSYNLCVSAWSSLLCSPRPNGFHTFSDITWSIVYNAVSEIRLAGSVSVEWFLAINFQFTVHTRSNGCHRNIAYITYCIS